MGLISIKYYFVMFCIVATFCYTSSVVVDVQLTRLDLIIKDTHTLLRSIEEQRAQGIDRQYRYEKLKSGFNPLFYPNLLRTSEGSFTKIAKKYDVAPLAPQPQESLYYCNEGYGILSYESDRYGFRNSDYVWDKGDKSFLIGDSFVQGACIPNEKHTIAGHLGELTNAINLGTGANGPIHYAAIAKAIVKQFDANNVLMVFYPNDNLTSTLDNTDSYFYKYYWEDTKKPYLLKRGSQFVLNPDLIAFYKSIQGLLQSEASKHSVHNKLGSGGKNESYYTSVEAREIAARNNKFVDVVSTDNFKLAKLTSLIYLLVKRQKVELPFSTKLAINELALACKKSCNAFVVYIPNSQLWRPDARSDSYRRGLREYTLNKNIAFIDTTKRLRLLGDSEAYATKGPHLSPKGYQVVSELISTAISR